MKNFYLIIFLLTLAVFTANAQSSLDHEPVAFTINISGEIIDQENGEAVPYVNIINKNTDQGTTSDLSGKFNIPVSQADTLIFSAVGFDKYTLVVANENVKDNQLKVKILLEPSTYELSPVNVYAYKDEASFKQAILDLDVPQSPQPKIVIPGSYDGPRHDLNGKFAISSPISAVQNLFSKEAKELRKYQEVMKEYPQQKLIVEKYNREVVEKITGLKDKELNEFMLFCKIPDDYIIKANDYEIILAVNECFKEFKENRN